MDDRMIALLKNAAKCFEQMYSPFCHEELLKLNVTSDECQELSVTISSILKEHIREDTDSTVWNYILSLDKSQKQIAKTRLIVQGFGMDYLKLTGPLLKVAVGKTDMIKNDVGFLMNFVRLDVLRQITDQDCSDTTTEGEK